MRLEALLAALLVLGPASISVQAEGRGRLAPPLFNGAEAGTIGRNELLNAIVEEDPWLVRRILDLVARRHAGRDFDPFAPTAEGVDPSRNPDLAGSTRTAAGSIEWIELLKRARAEKDRNEKFPGGMTGKSAASSVEFIEMLRRAKSGNSRTRRGHRRIFPKSEPVMKKHEILSPQSRAALFDLRFDICNHRQHQFKALHRTGNPALHVRR